MTRSSLAVIMDRLGISQGEVCRRTGLSRQTIADAYHGRATSPWTMARIAKEICVPLSTIDPVAAQDIDGLVIR
jgi:DNA-binding XRE family transcriptional regulator